MRESSRHESGLPRAVSRRSILCGTVGLGVAGLAAACSSGSSAPPLSSLPAAAATTRPQGSDSVLLVYFSRAGENYFYGDRTVLEVGNTEVLVGMIADRIGCEVYRIEPAEPYPFEYDETVERNRTEQRDGVRPVVANPIASVDPYSTVLVASPVWNSSAPMIMTTFVESVDLAGKTVYPITTHAVSGLSGVPRVYEQLCPDSTIGPGFTAQGEEVADSGFALDEWLRMVGLL